MTDQPTSNTPPTTEDGRPIKTLRQWRDLRNLTIRELAKAANMSTYTVQSIEKGFHEPRAETRKTLEAALGVHWTQIAEVRRALRLDPEPPQPETP